MSGGPKATGAKRETIDARGEVCEGKCDEAVSARDEREDAGRARQPSAHARFCGKLPIADESR
jgi:hypothetical protein